MKDNLLTRFKEFSNTVESCAIIFIKENVEKANGCWVDIKYAKLHKYSSDRFQFRVVTGRLYKRTIKPKYPSKKSFIKNGVFDKGAYEYTVRAITWDTANRDIENQKAAGVKPLNFEVYGVRYNAAGFFKDDAPEEIKALEKNLNDRTNPLWDRAVAFFAYPSYRYKVKSVKIFR